MERRTTLEKPIREVIFREYLGKCFYCGIELNNKNFAIDHVYPISRGGTNQLSNLVPSCNYCNSRKSNKTIYEFHDFLARTFDKKWIMRASCNYPIYSLEDNGYFMHFYYEYAVSQELWNENLIRGCIDASF